MKTLIVETDFSAEALDTVHYAANMARYLQVSLVLFHVIPAGAENTAHVLKHANEEIQALKEEVQRITGEKTAVSTEIRTGDLLVQLNNFCNQVQPYAVLMRSHKPAATAGFMPGNIALHAINNFPWPLLTIPPGTKFRQIRRTVLACDFKEIPESIPIEPIKSLVTEFRSHLYVLHINKMNESLNLIAFSDEFKRLREVMNDLHPVYRFSCNTDINGAINQFVEKNNFDLLILLPKKHYTPEKAFYKSYSRQLALHTNTPILSLHK